MITIIIIDARALGAGIITIVWDIVIVIESLLSGGARF